MPTATSPDSPGAVHAARKWRHLGLLSIAELLAMGLWFSASAVVPQLTVEWGLSAGEQSWVTMSVQIGFVVGALVSAALNLADRISMARLIAVSVDAARRRDAGTPAEAADRRTGPPPS